MNLYRCFQDSLFGDDRRAGTTLAVIVVGFSMFLLHWYQTPVDKLAHDFHVHVHYTEYLADTFTLPEPHLAYGFYHPPLYYIATAVVYKLTDWLGINPLVGISVLSLLFYGVYLVVAARLLMEHVSSLSAYYVGLGVLVFWPLGFNMARLINNDVPLFMCETIGFLYLMRWWKTRQPGDLVKALITCAVGMNIKSSAVVLAVTIGVLVLCRVLTRSFSFRPFLQRKMVLGIVAALIVVAVPISRSYYYYRIAEFRPAAYFLMAGVTPNPADSEPAPNNAFMDNSPYHFLVFDMGSYLTHPFYDVWQDAGGRQYFWVSILKTSLFDEFIWKGEGSARLLSILELAMMFYMGSTALMMWQLHKPDAQWAVFWLAIVIQLLSVMALRMAFPVSFHQEYRFIFATTALICVLYAKSIEWWQRQGRKRMAMAGCVIGVLFTLQSLCFIGIQEFNL